MKFQCEECGEIFADEPEGYEPNADGPGELAYTTCLCGGKAWELEQSPPRDQSAT